MRGSNIHDVILPDDEIRSRFDGTMSELSIEHSNGLEDYWWLLLHWGIDRIDAIRQRMRFLADRWWCELIDRSFPIVAHWRRILPRRKMVRSQLWCKRDAAYRDDDGSKWMPWLSQSTVNQADPADRSIESFADSWTRCSPWPRSHLDQSIDRRTREVSRKQGFLYPIEKNGRINALWRKISSDEPRRLCADTDRSWSWMFRVMDWRHPSNICLENRSPSSGDRSHPEEPMSKQERSSIILDNQSNWHRDEERSASMDWRMDIDRSHDSHWNRVIGRRRTYR